MSKKPLNVAATSLPLIFYEYGRRIALIWKAAGQIAEAEAKEASRGMSVIPPMTEEVRRARDEMLYRKAAEKCATGQAKWEDFFPTESANAAANSKSGVDEADEWVQAYREAHGVLNMEAWR